MVTHEFRGYTITGIDTSRLPISEFPVNCEARYTVFLSLLPIGVCPDSDTMTIWQRCFEAVVKDWTSFSKTKNELLPRLKFYEGEILAEDTTFDAVGFYSEYLKKFLDRTNESFCSKMVQISCLESKIDKINSDCFS